MNKIEIILTFRLLSMVVVTCTCTCNTFTWLNFMSMGFNLWIIAFESDSFSY